MTPEARLAFVIFVFAAWCFVGLVPWAVAAVVARGRGALPALPLALTAASAAGVVVPLAGLDDATGFFLSLATALLAGAVAAVVGIRLAQKLWPEQASKRTSSRTTVGGAEGERSNLTPDT